MRTPLYSAQTHVTGGREDGHGRSSDGRLAVDLRQPQELGGDGRGTNPEQLFAVGYAACFAATLALLGRRCGLDADDAAIDSTVALVMTEDGGIELGVELDISLPSIEDAGRAADLVHEAHQTCPYSRATRGNIVVDLMVNGTALQSDAPLRR